MNQQHAPHVDFRIRVQADGMTLETISTAISNLKGCISLFSPVKLYTFNCC